MNNNEETRSDGLALICDHHGLVLHVLHDTLGITAALNTDAQFPELVDEANSRKAQNFLEEIVRQRAAFDWEMNIPVMDQVMTLRFAGIFQNEQLLIVGAKTSYGVMNLFDAFMQINNEQTNALRAALKEVAELSREKTQRDNALYDELGRLNNQLMTVQRELAKRNNQLTALNELKNRFLGMAAHDLRNPLGIIRTFSDFVLDEAGDTLSEEHIEFLGVIRSSSDFMLHLIDDLLDVSIIESGKLRIELESVDLAELVRHNVKLNNTLANKKGITLIFETVEGLPEVSVDPAKIDQVLNNLISNAIKYSAPGTTVKVMITKRQVDSLPLHDTQPQTQSNVVISVQDQGQGIPDAELDKLFQMYSTTTVRSTAGEKSSGLGLAIAKKIIQEHHGEIWVESQPGVGSVFNVSLPLDNPGAAIDSEAAGAIHE